MFAIGVLGDLIGLTREISRRALIEVWEMWANGHGASLWPSTALGFEASHQEAQFSDSSPGVSP